jgi:hypothetical protein
MTCPWLKPQANVSRVPHAIHFQPVALCPLGNMAMSINVAMTLAFWCRTQVVLPKAWPGSEFSITDHVFDFTDIGKDVSTRPNIPMVNDAVCSMNGTCVDFFYKGTQANIEKYINDRPHDNDLFTCLKMYLGIHKPDYCDGVPATIREGAVVHVRQGDITPAKRTTAVHGLYGQPPLSFVLSAINHAKPGHVTLVGAPDNPSPVWTVLKRLSRFKVLNFGLDFQSRSQAEDIKALLCAKVVVQSRSTMMFVARFGHGTVFYSSDGCFGTAAANQKAFNVPLPQQYYAHFNHHTNSRQEWIDMLLSDAVDPIECNNNGTTNIWPKLPYSLAKL